jgi:hypothetical protein
MNEDNRDIDRLLQANVEGQLADIDWDRFHEDVGKRLATAGLHRRSRVKYTGPLAAAAGFILAAGVLVAVVAWLRAPTHVADGPESRITVSIQEPLRGAGAAAVVLAGNGKGITRCEVTLIDSKGPQQNEQVPTSWCIVARREPSSSRNVRSSDRVDIVRLF